MLRKSLVLVVLVLLIMSAVALGAEEIIIGLVTPVTGDVATFGMSVRNAALLWEKQVNSRGGIQGRKVKILVEDDKGTPAETANAVSKLISQSKVLMIMGPVTSNCASAGAPIGQANKVPVLTPTGTNPEITAIGDYVFRACFIDPFQGRVMAKFAIETLKAKTAAMLYDIGNPYTKGLAENFEKFFTSGGGKVVVSETYGAGESDFSAQLTKIKKANPDVLWLPDYYNTVGLITRQARQLGIKKAVFLGADGWDSPELLPIAGESIEGGFFSNHFFAGSTQPAVVAFVRDYKSAYESEPDALAALTWDACAIAESALNASIKKVGKLDRAALRDALAATRDAQGVSGKMAFDENRNPIKPAVILEVKNAKFAYKSTINP